MNRGEEPARLRGVAMLIPKFDIKEGNACDRKPFGGTTCGTGSS